MYPTYSSGAWAATRNTFVSSARWRTGSAQREGPVSTLGARASSFRARRLGEAIAELGHAVRELLTAGAAP
jgi:hypothetical protein